MILFSLGPFGPFAAWLASAVARIAELGLGPTAVVSADTPEELAGSLIRCASANVVAASRRPSPELRALLAGSGAPLLIAADEPWAGLFDLAAGHGQDLRAATRILADSCAAAMICTGMPKVLVIGSDAARQDMSGTLGRIAQFCGLDIAPDRTGLPVPPRASIAASEWWRTLDPDQRAIAEGALNGYMGWLAGTGFGEITWDRRLFYEAADRSRDAGAAIDIGETPGILVDGPWIGLPPGRWAASITLAVTREVNGARFDIAIHPGLATGSIICDGRGLGSATLLFTIEPSWGQTVSLTVASTAPAPGGRLALGNVVLAPAPSEGSGIPAELSTALSL